MPINRIDPSSVPTSAAEFRAAGLVDRKKAMADYVARRKTAELRRLREQAATVKGEPAVRRKRVRPEDRPDLFFAGDPVKRRIGI